MTDEEKKIYHKNYNDKYYKGYYEKNKIELRKKSLERYYKKRIQQPKDRCIWVVTKDNEIRRFKNCKEVMKFLGYSQSFVYDHLYTKIPVYGYVITKEVVHDKRESNCN